MVETVYILRIVFSVHILQIIFFIFQYVIYNTCVTMKHPVPV